jgi:Uma2 family endonuclease
MSVVTERSTIDAVPRSEYVPTADQLITMSCVSWDAFEAFIALRGDTAGPRVTYLEGTLQLMSPSFDHEWIKKCLAAVVEAHLDHEATPYQGVGSWLLKLKKRKTGVEPDECYLLHDLTRRDRPDLAIEVVWTSGGINKLQVYKRFGVPEVWQWKNGVLELYVLGSKGYERRERSEQIPSFDPALFYEMLKLEYLSRVRAALRKHFG